MIIFLGRPHAKRLLTFFLAGALLVSVSIGLAAVSVLDAANLGSSTRRSVGGGVYLAIGAAALAVGLHFLRTAPKVKKKKEKSGPSMSQRVLTKDSTWLVFVLGIVLNMPGLWYIMGLKNIGLGNYSEAVAVLLVLGFNLIMFSFIEVPLVGYLVAPTWTQAQVAKFNSWLHRNGRHLGGWIGVVLGCYLIVRGIVALV